jgi:WD40 repeat protein
MMKKLGLSNDEVIEITYTFAMHKPKEDQKIENEEWINVIKSVFIFDDSNQPGPFVVGYFDGKVKLYDVELNELYDKQLHEDTVNDIIFTSGTPNNYRLVTAGEDGEIGVHDISINEIGEVVDNRVANIKQHANALSFCPTNSDMITFAGNDTLLKIVDISPEVLKRNRDAPRKRDAKTPVAWLEPIASIEGNKNPINCLKWINNSEIVTGGYDHAIRIFDTEKEVLSNSIFTSNKTTTCIDSMKDNIIVGCEDHHIRLWDIRSSSADPVKIFKGHKGWVSTVRMNPTSDYHFISSAYDCKTLVWDFR